MLLQPWQRSFKQTKWKSCIQRKCLLLSGHFVFIVSSEIRTRAARERGKGNKKGRTLSRKRLISQQMKTHHYYHLQAVMRAERRLHQPMRGGEETKLPALPRHVITRWMQDQGYFHKTTFFISLLCLTENTQILDRNWPISLSTFLH